MSPRQDQRATEMRQAVPDITDEYMREMLAKSRPYALVLLRVTPALRRPDADPIIWEHGRRNFSLRADGRLAIVTPVSDGSGLAGIYLFNTPPEEAATIMEEDPGVKAGIFSYEVHPARGFPGDCLPG